MAKKKRRSRWDQRFFAWLERQPEGGVLHRMAYCTAVSNALKEEQPFWYWIVVIGLLFCVTLPMGLYSFIVEQAYIAGWKVLFYLIGLFASIFTGVGTVNLYMIPIEWLCAWRLHEDFPRGFPMPFYLGHRITLIFLGGCGTLATLCAFLIHFLA